MSTVSVGGGGGGSITRTIFYSFITPTSTAFHQAGTCQSAQCMVSV